MANRNIQIIWQGVYRRKRTLYVNHLNHHKKRQRQTPLGPARVTWFGLEVPYIPSAASGVARASWFGLEVPYIPSAASGPVRVSWFGIEAAISIPSAQLPFRPWSKRPRPWQLKKRRQWPQHHRQLDASLITIDSATFSPVGRATVAGVGFSEALAHFNVQGQATVTGLSGSKFNQTGQATVSGIGLAPTFAHFNVAGQATVAGVGFAPTYATFGVTGHATVAGAALSEDFSHFTVAGQAAVAGVGFSKAFATFGVQGQATVKGVPGSDFAITGRATVAGVGFAPTFAHFGVTGHATVSGITLQIKDSTFGVTGHATVAGVAGGGAIVKTGFIGRETLVGLTAVTKAALVAREVLSGIPPPAKTAGVVREVLSGIPPPAKVGGVAREILTAIPPPAKTALVVREVLYRGPAITQAVGTAHGHATVSGVSQPYTVIVAFFPPARNTSVQSIIPAYLYVQYNDDDNLQSMVAAFNAYQQAYLDYLNALELPVYTNGTIAGPLLDWVATGLYGFPRPGLPSAGKPPRGPFNTYCFNQNPITFNGHVPGTPETYIQTSDDIYKRCLTWLFYKGDGFQFTTRWLKRRVMRFLNGINGTSFPIDETYPVSVDYTALRAVTIKIPTSPVAKIFKAAVQAGVLTLPFNIEWTVTLV